jgi:hypothetical protein
MLYIKFWILAGLHIPIDIYVKITLRPFQNRLQIFKSDHKHFSYGGKSIVSRRRSRSRPRSWTFRLRIQNSSPCYGCLDTNGMSCKFQLSRYKSGQKICDRRTDDVTMSVENIYFKNVRVHWDSHLEKTFFYVANRFVSIRNHFSSVQFFAIIFPCKLLKLVSIERSYVPNAEPDENTAIIVA